MNDLMCQVGYCSSPDNQLYETSFSSVYFVSLILFLKSYKGGAFYILTPMSFRTNESVYEHYGTRRQTHFVMFLSFHAADALGCKTRTNRVNVNASGSDEWRQNCLLAASFTEF